MIFNVLVDGACIQDPRVVVKIQKCPLNPLFFCVLDSMNLHYHSWLLDARAVN